MGSPHGSAEQTLQEAVTWTSRARAGTLAAGRVCLCSSLAARRPSFVSRLLLRAPHPSSLSPVSSLVGAAVFDTRRAEREGEAEERERERDERMRGKAGEGGAGRAVCHSYALRGVEEEGKVGLCLGTPRCLSRLAQGVAAHMHTQSSRFVRPRNLACNCSVVHLSGHML